MIYATRGAIFDGFMAKLHFDIFVYFYFLGSRRREPPRRGHSHGHMLQILNIDATIIDVGSRYFEIMPTLFQILSMFFGLVVNMVLLP